MVEVAVVVLKLVGLVIAARRRDENIGAARRKQPRQIARIWRRETQADAIPIPIHGSRRDQKMALEGERTLPLAP